MKNAFEPDLYELLEIERDASPTELERAYRITRAAWADDSLATYSLFGEDDAAAVRERLDRAYEVLSDPERRARYDASLGGPPPAPDEGVPAPELVERPVAPAQVEPEITGFEGFEDSDDDPYDGARLRRARMRHGIGIDRIAEVTKINPTYLRFLEEEQFDDLPAAVYVRGFVTAYARCVGLDPARVVPPFMERLRAAREPEPGGRPERR
jgi:flagellar biosynthesis protein FlhG